MIADRDVNDAEEVDFAAWDMTLIKMKEFDSQLSFEIPCSLNTSSHYVNAQYAAKYREVVQKFIGHDTGKIFDYVYWLLIAANWQAALGFKIEVESDAKLNRGSTFIEPMLRAGVIKSIEDVMERFTAVGNAKHYGWSYSLYLFVFHSNFNEFTQAIRSDFEVPEISSEDIFYALELIWISCAHEEKFSKEESLELMFEAGETKTLIDGLCMWKASADEAVSKIAGAGGRKKKENFENKRPLVYKWCDENMCRFTKSKAAYAIAEEGEIEGMKIGLRKAAEFIADWDKARKAAASK